MLQLLIIYFIYKNICVIYLLKIPICESMKLKQTRGTASQLITGAVLATRPAQPTACPTSTYRLGPPRIPNNINFIIQTEYTLLLTNSSDVLFNQRIFGISDFYDDFLIYFCIVLVLKIKWFSWRPLDVNTLGIISSLALKCSCIYL